MVHIPNTYAHDYWLRSVADQIVELSCLMPNGVFIPMEVRKSATLHEIKEELWDEATKFPLHGTLHDSSSYIFSCTNSMAQQEELLDETRRLCDVRPYFGVLQVIERKDDKDDKTLNTEISKIIGRGLHEFDALKNPEVNYFRWKMRLLADETSRARQNKAWLDRVYYQYPPRISNNHNFPETVSNNLREGNIILVIRFENIDSSYKMSVPHKILPSTLMTQILAKKAKIHQSKGDQASEYLLKVRGQEEYFIREVSLIQYLYVQECLAGDTHPVLVVVNVNSIPLDSDYNNNPENGDEMKRGRNSFSTLVRRKGRLVSSWTIDANFKFQVSAICRLNCDATRTVEVCVQAGLFHGGKALCETKKSSERQVSKEGIVQFDQNLEFNIKVCNIPRMARLCFVVYEISKYSKSIRSKKIKDSKPELQYSPMGWVNTTVFDFKNQMKTGAMTLYMWNYAEDSQSEDLLHPLGTVVSNPNPDSAALTITFYKLSDENTVVYPTMEKILETSTEKPVEPMRMNPRAEDQIKSLVGRDPFHEMHEQERKALWSLRHDIKNSLPYLLPKLLDCVEWNEREEVCEAMVLIAKWPLLAPEKALELLDYAYADQMVRSFAVKCLAKVSDDDLSLYLLQLVQALKHESYLHCDLVEFLLKRALSNQKIGHFLFWHLRSEMTVPSVWIRFGLMLEAYCRGSREHMKALGRQVTFLNNIRTISEEVKQKKDKDKARHYIQEILTETHMEEAVRAVLSPLDPSYRCKCVRVDKCRVMDSKMRPLWIVLGNHDPYGDDIYLIFKNGDDLRQDMLTLQMIRIMDRLWKNEGLDLRMNPYGCVSTDNKVGLIEVVLNAETIANIQKEKGIFSATSAFKKGSLLAWLKDHNPSESSLNKAVEEFTYSCAGYCVATYVLGVADRHSDNIMVKRTGQLFHIDFGHILGHFKEKFGFRRERVPFVLTHDFVHVINKGLTRREGIKFEVFKKCCEQAFLILRRHGYLILSLFAMMISTGLPELSSEADLNYLRETLVLDLDEKDAVVHFQSKFDEALCNSWKTSLNWASHNMAKNNKQ